MTIPEELQRSTPRPVSLTAAGWTAIRTYGLKAATIIAVAAWLYLRAGPAERGVSLRGLGWNFGVGLIFAVAVTWMTIRRQSRLLMYGRAAVARVTGDVTPWWQRLRIRSRYTNRLQCEFRLLNGGTCRTTVYGRFDRRDKAPGENAEIIVVYDPDEPEKAAFYPPRLLKVTSRLQ